MIARSAARMRAHLEHFSGTLSADMGFNCGIVGLPNVGKSTPYNALELSTNPLL